MTKLSINLVHQGRYVKAGDELPPGFELPLHLEPFVIDGPQQISRATSEERGTGTRLAKPAMDKKGK